MVTSVFVIALVCWPMVYPLHLVMKSYKGSHILFNFEFVYIRWCVYQEKSQDDWPVHIHYCDLSTKGIVCLSEMFVSPSQPWPQDQNRGRGNFLPIGVIRHMRQRNHTKIELDHLQTCIRKWLRRRTEQWYCPVTSPQPEDAGCSVTASPRLLAHVLVMPSTSTCLC